MYKTFKVIKEGSQRIVENEPGDAQLRVSGGAALVGEKKTDQCHPTGAKLRLSTTFSNKVLDSTKSFTFLITKKEEVAGLPESALGLASQTARLRITDLFQGKELRNKGACWLLVTPLNGVLCSGSRKFSRLGLGRSRESVLLG